MTKTKRVAAMMMAAAMGTSMIGVIPAAAEEESKNIWASDVDTSEPMEYGYRLREQLLYKVS